MSPVSTKVALDEHFATPEIMGDPREYFYADRVGGDRTAIARHRRPTPELMDETGIEIAIISLNSPAIQAIPDPADPVQKPA